MPKLKPGTILPTTEEDAAITAAAMDDHDARPFSEEEWKAAKLTAKRGRGRPAGSGGKVATNIRFDGDLIEAFKATGDGWQTRMNDALRDWAKRHRMLAR